ncbi:hypothetical protein STSP2_02449 [Anaerohalosphaera lusitana]|uniref:Uncharacterized protein n=1 Tax=Anaerohalosphaera lusitana TaxID=1936003 RepID=A0A1U9NNR6_9BACT|nr:hypothetical protein [Anaerohalosphaera lusitana]AQT69260.1 hypothetical protein STSP2_02449 [Anaerohalosphaera lusitana]
MTSEHIFIQEVLATHNISIQQLANAADLAAPTVYEYTGGRRKHIPLCIWRALYALTEDIRILDLIIGEVDRFVCPLPKTPDETHNDTLARLIEKRRKDIECEMAILEILADGQIDAEDRVAVEQYKNAHPESMKLSAQIYYSIIKKYEQAINGKEQA